jgi:hypothetical protein
MLIAAALTAATAPVASATTVTVDSGLSDVLIAGRLDGTIDATGAIGAGWTVIGGSLTARFTDNADTPDITRVYGNSYWYSRTYSYSCGSRWRSRTCYGSYPVYGRTVDITETDPAESAVLEAGGETSDPAASAAFRTVGSYGFVYSGSTPIEKARTIRQGHTGPFDASLILGQAGIDALNASSMLAFSILPEGDMVLRSLMLDLTLEPSPHAPAPVPLPAPFALLAGALAALGVLRRRSRV